MSSYLNFYGIPKPKDKEKISESSSNMPEKPINIVSFSRNNDIYRYFNENCSIVFRFQEEKYSDITVSDIEGVKDDILKDIESSKKRLCEYEKYAASHPDYIQEILSVKEYLEELYEVLHYTEFVGLIVRDAEHGFSGFKRIVANIS